MIGPQGGTNLTEGLKARISLARALYADNDLVLSDDPFRHLDSQTATNIFERVFQEKMVGKTRLMVTNSREFMQKVDRIIFMHEGEIVLNGPYEEVKDSHFLKALLNVESKF